jgi:hypothetical protein
MEMAIRKAAVCLTLMCVILAGAARAQEFPARHKHWRKFCEGTLTVADQGVRFAGPKGHAWSWPYRDIQQLTLTPTSIHILSYKDSSLKLGKDEAYTFTGKFPTDALYRQWSAKLDQRFVAEVGPASAPAGVAFPAKLLGLTKGMQGTLVFAPDVVTFDDHTWRYSDIQSIASSGPFQLSIMTLEKQYRFQLKQPIDESTYNQLWLDIEKKNRRIQ